MIPYPRFIILMGVTGSGKTTLGKMLAEKLGWDFYDGDDYHLPENISKMSAGIPLTDADRADWLERLAALISESLGKGRPGVMACSALKQKYRDVLAVDPQQVRFVYLKGTPQQIRLRVQNRPRHYMQADMVESQFAALEEPFDVFTIDIDCSLEESLNLILKAFHLDVDRRS